MRARNTVLLHVVQDLWLTIPVSAIFQRGVTPEAASCDGKMVVCQWWQCGILVI
jgi:hypothetical protein